MIDINIYDEIVLNMEKLIDAYPFSNNNACHNNAIRMCIALVSNMKNEKKQAEEKVNKNQQY